MSSIANDITAEKKKLSAMLSEKYTVDYFQREYKWERRHIEQLLVDLEAAFFSNYEYTHTIANIEDYNCYYLGPIVVSKAGRNRSIVDGQQRLTSITLLLIYLNNLQKNMPEKEDIASLIFSRKGGQNSYNIEVPERQTILESLFNDTEIIIDESSDISVKNMYERYTDIVELFSDELKGDKLPMFIEWLKNNVVFVEIFAYSNENAYTIFETMNDRGLNLTPTEMLKGYILSNIEIVERIDEVNELWRQNIAKLNIYTSQEDQEFFKAWLRGAYADTIRQSIKGAENEDFEKIGTRFHTWVRDNHKKIGLTNKDAFYYFIKSEFDFYSNLYLRILKAERSLYPELEIVFLASKWNIANSLTYPLVMAAINRLDDEQTIIKKINLIYRFLDIYTVSRTVNYKSITQTAIRYTIYSLVKEVRNKDIDELCSPLRGKIDNLQDKIDALSLYDCSYVNRRFVHYLLARMTYYIERRFSDDSSLSFVELLPSKRRNRFITSQIVTNDTDIYGEYFANEDELYSCVKKIGNYVLIYNDVYSLFSENDTIDKLELIKDDNILSRSLTTPIPMLTTIKTMSSMGIDGILQRTEELVQLAKSIWNVDHIRVL